MAVGWRDNRGRFHEVPGAKPGQSRQVDTGAGLCFVKVWHELDPDHQATPHLRSSEYRERSDEYVVKCSCGWYSFIAGWAFTSEKAAQNEIERRFAAHVEEVRG